MRSKVKISCSLSAAPDKIFLEVRKTTPNDNGNFDVHYVMTSSDQIAKTILDPRIVTLEKIIQSGQVIDPGQVHTLLDLSDKADINAYADKMSSDSFEKLKEVMTDFDFDKNEKIVES